VFSKRGFGVKVVDEVKYIKLRASKKLHGQLKARAALNGESLEAMCLAALEKILGAKR